jgi:hypothetical protein
MTLLDFAFLAKGASDSVLRIVQSVVGQLMTIYTFFVYASLSLSKADGTAEEL